MNKAKRLDVLLVENKYCESRNKANFLIKNGYVCVDGICILDVSKKININEKIEININKDELRISRGFTKLEKAIEFFNIDLKNHICVDIGSSTGGFTECLLKNEAKKIYAIDCGKDQLHNTLKENKNVISLESTNFIKIEKTLIVDKVDFISCDVSFISSEKIINKIIDLGWKNFESVFLFKPQFEAGKKIISKTKGYVDEKFHNSLIENFLSFLMEKKFRDIKYIDSPISGKKMNNKEYLFYMKMDNDE
ncbi:MAG: TlyA family RNA methyltransferase [Malacoplasma sp.]